MSNSGARALDCTGFRVFGGIAVQLAFMDEFGHIGPFVGRSDPRFNQSPVFGLAGYVIPHNRARNFATFFLHLKRWMLAAELAHVQKHPSTWEKKGKDLLTTSNIRRYRHLREGITRLLNRVYKDGGKIFWYGREKYLPPDASNASGLYTTVMGHTIRRLNQYVARKDGHFMMIIDQHSDRTKLLETAAKTMFGAEDPARCLIEPPFQVESHLYQTIQAADWIATLIGRMHAFTVAPDAYPEWEWAERLYGAQLRALATDQHLWRPRREPALPF